MTTGAAVPSEPGGGSSAQALPAAPLPPLALYVHLPWCIAKCPYCDFNSFALKGPLEERAYVDALLADLEVQAPMAAGRRLVSVFFGGGTPSLFSPGSFARLLEAAQAHVGLEPAAEVTLEANPGTLERGRFAEYRAAGINRVSLGAQSFDADVLRQLGRVHGPDDTRRAVAELHAAGLANFNLDLMYGLPGQDVRGALSDVDAALGLDPAHLSHYQLTLEPGTPFAARPPVLPADEEAVAMLAACAARLGAASHARYEVSAWARPGRRCVHNLNYWQFGDYLGLGAGAHGKLTAQDGLIRRTERPRDPRRFTARSTEPPAMRTLATAQLPFEFMLNALRLVEGFELELFEQRTGADARDLMPRLQMLATRGLLEELEPGHFRPSARGLDFLNDLLLEFLPEKP